MCSGRESQPWGNLRELLGIGVPWGTGAMGSQWNRERALEEGDVPGRGHPEEGLTSSILVHHAQSLCLVLPLEGIEVQDTEEGGD